ncbi:Uncharacterised protein [Bordetella pertussis]|nr:Uncharacterised protein [Bordetella pertussis]
MGERVRVQGAQFLDILGQEVERRVGMIHAMFADLGGQIARRLHRRVQQHGLAAQPFGQPGGVIAAQRRADHCQPAGILLPGQLLPGQRQRQLGGLLRAGRQLRALPLAGQAALVHGLRQQARLERVGRRTETVQVQDGHRGAFSGVGPGRRAACRARRRSRHCS